MGRAWWCISYRVAPPPETSGTLTGVSAFGPVGEGIFVAALRRPSSPAAPKIVNCLACVGQDKVARPSNKTFLGPSYAPPRSAARERRYDPAPSLEGATDEVRVGR